MKKIYLACALCLALFLLNAQETKTLLKNDVSSKTLPSDDVLSDELQSDDVLSKTLPSDEVPSEDILAEKLISIDMIIPDHELVEYYKKQYLSESAKKWLASVMTSAAPYRAYIIKELESRGLPLCLQYLPVIESNYKLTALSKSGAVGMWQFMKNSIAPFNIRINDWMDERRDPWLSTTAALRKLDENYTFFNDWYLALAAYNAGLGGISRKVKAAGKNDYWYLLENGFLSNESKHYVPKFLAISHILENHEFYGIHYPDPNLISDPSVNYDEITVNQAIALDLLAEKAKLDENLLYFFNPALYYGITPIDTSYTLRLPQGSAEKVNDLLQEDSFELMHYSMYTIKSGDTLFALSLYYSMSVAAIQRINNLSSSKIIIGQKLIIPTFKNIEEYEGRKADETLSFNGIYIVQKTDTLWSLSLHYDVQVEQLASENNMSLNDVLRIGSRLKVPIID